MSAPDLPAAGYVSDDARQEAEMKAAFESMVAVSRRTLGAADDQDIEVSAGTITPAGTASVLNVSAEGGAGSDFLDFIDGSNYPLAAVLVLYSTSGDVTIRHGQVGSGRINLSGGGEFLLGIRNVIMLRRSLGGSWQEMFRGWGDNPTAMQAFLQLGSAAYQDEGSGNGLDADTLDGLDASDFYQTGSQVGDAASVGGVAATDLMRLSLAALQTAAGEFQSDGGAVRANTPAAGLAARHEMRIEGTLRASLAFDDVTDALQVTIFEADGSTTAARLRMDVATGELTYDPVGNGPFLKVWHEGNDGSGSGLDADTVKGEEVIAVSAITSASAAGGFPAGGGSINITMDARSFFPGVAVFNGTAQYKLGAGGPGSPGVFLWQDPSTFGSAFTVYWDYIA